MQFSFKKKNYLGRNVNDPNGMKPNKHDRTFYVLMGIGYLVLILFTLHYCAQTTAYQDADIFEKAQLALTEMVKHPVQFIAIPSNVISSILSVSTVYLIVGYYAWLEKIKNEHINPALIGGTAKFNDDIKTYNLKFSAPYGKPTSDGDINTILTNDVYLSMNTRHTRRNLNLLVIGGSGAGKSRYLVKPNLCQMPLNCNFVCTDPSGELLTDMGKMLEDFGFTIKVFNVVDMSKSSHYNPLKYINNVNDVILLTDCILANTTDPNKKGGDDFWEKAQKLMFQAFISFLWMHGEEFGLKPNMASIMTLIRDCQVPEDDASSTDGLNKVDILFKAIEYGYERDDSGKIIPGDENNIRDNNKGREFCVKQYNAFKLGAGKTLKSILISAYARLSCFDSEDVLSLTEYDNLNLEELAEKKSALFIIIPQENDSFNFLVAMMYSQLFQTLYFKAENACQGNYIVKDARGENVKVFEMKREINQLLDTDDEDSLEEEISIHHLLQKKNNKKNIFKNLFKFSKKKKKFSDSEDKNSQKDVDFESPEVMAALDEKAAENEKNTIPDIDPGDEKDKDAEAQANEYVERLKSCHLVKKGSRYIIKLPNDNGEEDIVGVYGNKEYAIERTAALQNSKVERCGLFLPFHVRMMLDEFANIGQIPNFTKLLATMRKYEISCSVILQSIAQIKNMYKDDWGTIIGNCDSFLFLGCPEYDTQEYVSKKLGKTTIRTRSESQSTGKKSGSQSYQWTSRDLMSPEELDQLNDDECILFIRGVHPFRGKKFAYETHKNFKYTADANKKNLYQYKIAAPSEAIVNEDDINEDDNIEVIKNKVSESQEINNDQQQNFPQNDAEKNDNNAVASNKQNDNQNKQTEIDNVSSVSTSSPNKAFSSTHRTAFNSEPSSLPRISSVKPQNEDILDISKGRKATEEDLIVAFAESIYVGDDEQDKSETPVSSDDTSFSFVG